MNTTAIYERVSSLKQSTESQKADLEAFGAAEEAKGRSVKRYLDKFTGKTLDRPDMNRLLADMRAGKIQTIVVWRLDRLGRTASGLTKLFEEFQTLGVNFVSIRDGIDLSTAAGRLIANVLASVAAYETEIRSERIAAGISAKRARGERWNNGRRRGDCHKTTQEVRAVIHSMKGQGDSVATIARVLKLSRPTVYAVLKAE